MYSEFECLIFLKSFYVKEVIVLVNLFDIVLLAGAFVLTVLSLVTVAVMIDMKMKTRIWLTILMTNIFFIFAIIYLMGLRGFLTSSL